MATAAKLRLCFAAMLESRRLKHFLTVFELGSIGQAADKLLLTQPALSKSIRQLEDELGVRLFDRTTLGVVPTTFGKALALHAKAIEAQVRQAEAQIASLRGDAKGRVCIGIGPSIAPALMPLATISLHRLQPGIELVVTEGLVDELIPALRRGEVDVAVGSWPRLADTAFATEILLTDAIHVVARADHPLAGREVPLAELLQHPWALPPATQRWRQQFDELFFSEGLSPPKPSVTSNSASYLKGVIRRGDYLSFLPRLLVEGDDGLAQISTTVPTFRPEVSITYKERRLSDPAVTEVVQVLRAVAAEASRH
jgi:DNA-binding transcriptional LysR family regulator